MLWKLSKADRFWTWFGKNLRRMETLALAFKAGEGLEPRHQKSLTALTKALARFDGRIMPFGGIGRDGVFELTLSSHGKADAFPAIFELASAAPPIPGWRVVALKPRGDLGGDRISTNKVAIDLTTLRYDIEPSGALPEILLLVDHEPEEHWDHYQFLGEMIVISLLGEHDYADLIGSITFVSRDRYEAQMGHDGDAIMRLTQDFPPRLLH